MALHVKKSTGWTTVNSFYVKKSTGWTSVTKAFVKKAVGWVQFWPQSGPSIDFPLEITASSSSWPSTLTGKNYHWENASTLSYKFQSSLTNTTDNSAWTDLMSYASIANPATGNFNTQTFSITSADFSTTVRSKWFRFVVKGTDSATGTITTEVSNNVNISKSALVGTAGTVVIARSSASSYVYSVTNNGTWSSTPVSYSYQWQQLLSGTWTDIAGATSISKDMTSFVQKDVRCQVYAVDDLGATSQLPITSNSLFVDYAPPSVTSFTATGGVSKITYSYVVASDNQFPTITLKIERLQSGGSYLQTNFVNLTPKTGTNVIESITLSGTYRATLTASDGINPDSSIVVNNLTVANLNRTNVAIAQTTTNLSGASNITFSKTGTGTGQTGVIGWTNGSGVQTSDVSWSGNYSGTDFNKAISGATQSSSFLLSAATGTASITATVVQKAQPQATISWDQTNAQSYRVTYRVSATANPSAFVDTVLTGNSSASSVSLIVNAASATVRVLEVIVYEYINQNSGQPTGSVVGNFTITPSVQVTLGATQDFTTSASGTITYLYAPTNATRPTWTLLSGTAGVTGAAYRLNFGTWNNSPTSYRYEIAYNNQAGTVIFSGSTTSTFVDNTFNTANANSITGFVWASNSTGESSVATTTTSIGPFSAPVLAPTNATAPTLTPTSISVGTLLTAGVGTWNNTPTSYDIRIYRGTANVSTGETLVASGTSTSLTYTVTLADYNSGQLYFRTYVNASNSGGSSGFVAGQERGPIATPVSVPTNSSIPTTSGGLAVGSVVNFGVGSWTGSPTSYDLRLYRGTAGVVMSETLVKSAGNVASSTYTITASDFSSGQLYLRSYASASNSAGTSGFAAGQEIGPITSGGGGGAVPVLISLTGNNSLALGGTFSWSFSNSPTAYSILVTGPSGTVYTTSNAYTYTGTTFRPGYDGTGWQGAGDYTIYISARNATGNSIVSSLTTYMN